MEMITHKVTILTVNMRWGNYDDESDRWLSRHVTEWQEISDEDFKFLQQGIMRYNTTNPNLNLILIEQPRNQSEILFNTINEAKDLLKKMEEDYRLQQLKNDVEGVQGVFLGKGVF